MADSGAVLVGYVGGGDQFLAAAQAGRAVDVDKYIPVRHLLVGDHVGIAVDLGHGHLGGLQFFQSIDGTVHGQGRRDDTAQIVAMFDQAVSVAIAGVAHQFAVADGFEQSFDLGLLYGGRL